jgi:hypothetical protein
MTTSFAFEIADYRVGMGWSTELTDFKWIFIESVAVPWLRITGTLYFFPSGRSDQSRPVRYFGSARHLIVTLALRDFDSMYAVLRSERPVFLRGGGADDLIEYLELHSNPEPVGEVDASAQASIVIGTGDVITEVQRLAAATG